MKLYYSAGSCSDSCHITLEESGLKYEALKLNWDNASDANVAAVKKLNGMGTVPVLITDDGKQLDQNISIHVYVADKAPEKKLLPAVATYERYQALNWLSFAAADLHKSVGGLFGTTYISEEKSVQEAFRKFMLGKANECLSYMDGKLAGKDFLMGKTFSPADAYAFIVTNWTHPLEVPLTPYKNIESYMKRLAERPAFAKVLKEQKN